MLSFLVVSHYADSTVYKVNSGGPQHDVPALPYQIEFVTDLD